MEDKKVWLIINPKSGGGNSIKQKKLIQARAIEMGWRGKYVEATASKHSKVWMDKAIEAKIKDFVIGGGDGTIRDVLKPVVDGKITLGILPLGTGNVLARNLGIPLDLDNAIQVALHGKIKRIDVGEANGNYFGVVVGMGLDVEAMENTKNSSKGRWGIFAYLWSGLHFLSEVGEKYRLVINHKDSYVYRARSIMVANMARTIAGIEVAAGAGPQSGDLKVVIIQPADLGSWINLIVNILRKSAKKSLYYKLYRAQHVEIYPLNGPRKYECDGDKFPPTDKLEISLHPKALKVRVPTANMSSRMVNEKKKILVFDFDGTLADTLQTTISVFNTLADRYKYPKVNKEQVEVLRGQSVMEALKQLGIHKTRFPKLLIEGRKEFAKQEINLEIFPGMRKVLLKLKEKYGLGIVTSNEVKNVDAFLKRNDLQIFDFIYSDKSIFGKGVIFRRLMHKYGFDHTNLLYVGDEVRDIEAARESKIKVAAVGWGFNNKELLLKNNPDFWVAAPKDLVKLKF